MRQREQRDHDGERRHRPTPDFHKNDAGRFEILLHKALLNPVHHLVVEDLLHKTLQDPVLGQNQHLLRDTTRQLPRHPSHPHHPGTHFGAPWRRPRQGWSAGAWVSLPRREATLDGQVLRAATPWGVLPIIGLISLPLQPPG